MHDDRQDGATEECHNDAEANVSDVSTELWVGMQSASYADIDELCKQDVGHCLENGVKTSAKHIGRGSDESSHCDHDTLGWIGGFTAKEKGKRDKMEQRTKNTSWASEEADGEVRVECDGRACVEKGRRTIRSQLSWYWRHDGRRMEAG